MLMKLYKEELLNTNNPLTQIIITHGQTIIDSKDYQRVKNYIQHGHISVYEHSIFVAYVSLYICLKLHLKVNYSALIRGALLHDYFLYDWHIHNGHHLHAFTHASTALNNASIDFEINEIEHDIIKKHMFPLTITPPKYKESIIVCVADKLSATLETLFCRS